jgi:hypothetical protein
MVPLIVLYFAAAGITALNDKRRERKVAEIDDQIEASINNQNEA